MKFDEKYKISPGLEDLFSFESKDQEIEHEAYMIMFRFLSEFQKFIEATPVKKKELAEKLNTSASYITQLFNGDKLINLMTIAKIQDAFGVTFDIKAKSNSQTYSKKTLSKYQQVKAKEPKASPLNLLILSYNQGIPSQYFDNNKLNKRYS